MDFVKTGSVRELWRVSYPMMVSFFSMMLMLFIDRLFLSFYSTEALNASAQAGTLAWGFILAWMTLASMSEVFVAQYNGAKHLSRIGSAVWQMLYLVLISFLFFFPLAYFVTPLFYERGGYAFNFFSLLMYFGPLFTLVPALAGFFIGRGDTRIIQWMAILANIVNCILDPILIFTFDLGVKGAAIATGLGTLVEALFLLYLFLKPSHRTMFGTLSLAFNPSLFLQTIKIGLPPALFVSMELLGWAAFYHLMATISPTHIFVSTVCQTVLLPFLFFGMGLEKGCIALAGNFIGAGKLHHISTVLRSGLKLIIPFTILSFLILIAYPHPIINQFIKDQSLLDTAPLIRLGLISVAFYVLFENVRWIVNGILTAAGDTLFLMFAGTASIWCFMLLPTYFLIVVPKAPVQYAFLIWLLYSFVSLILISLRFAYGKWKQSTVIQQTESASPH